jgi:transcriptional regulator with XRE-family HTH domain
MTLRQWLKETGLNQQQLARHLRVAPITISRYIHRHRMPTPDMMRKIALVTKGNVRPDDWHNLGSYSAKTVVPLVDE